MDTYPQLISKVVTSMMIMLIIETIILVCIDRHKNHFNFYDTFTSITLGLYDQMTAKWAKVLMVTCLNWCHAYKLYDIPADSLWGWILLIFGFDFAYYLFHRNAHEKHFLWAAHMVHHSGEYYNLSTALRQASLKPWDFVFYVWLGFFFTPAQVMIHAQLNLYYQFWIHTSVVGKLGPLELVMNTASHHRMHHRPPGNRNYAAVFIIWDKMFGTFEEEDVQKDYYGLAKQMPYYDAVLINVEHYFRMFGNKTDTFVSKLKKFLGNRVSHKKTLDMGALFKAHNNLWDCWTVPAEPYRRKIASINYDLTGLEWYLVYMYVFYNFAEIQIIGEAALPIKFDATTFKVVLLNFLLYFHANGTLMMGVKDFNRLLYLTAVDYFKVFFSWMTLTSYIDATNPMHLNMQYALYGNLLFNTILFFVRFRSYEWAKLDDHDHYHDHEHNDQNIKEKEINKSKND